MKYIFFCFLTMSLFGSLSAEVFTLSSEDAKKIGNKIWHNECNGTLEGLTSWHPNERFASVGIGHFIWFPQDAQEHFNETFPSLALFLKENKVTLPAWLMVNDKVIACPWKNKQEFDKQFQSSKMQELRTMLKNTVELQIRFIIDRFKVALDDVLKRSPKRKQAHVRAQLRRLMESSQGLYALIDYVNFKGSGLTTSEKYNAQGWGLLQVLEGMHGTERGKDALKDFVESAKKVLETRVANAPKEKNEDRFLTGWQNRLKTYLNEL